MPCVEITDVGTVTVGHHSGMPSATFSRASADLVSIRACRIRFDEAGLREGRKPRGIGAAVNAPGENTQNLQYKCYKFCKGWAHMLKNSRHEKREFYSDTENLLLTKQKISVCMYRLLD